ncbi:tRNA-modifying protein YgfZ [Candidatus Blochmannia ocreatus (nom. nud.)]|uniref:tRNA-modifying protein YgfZ n=1 Tax=Candidatus Blochmannia ocreatus (nom. nud.) TaxID=251538 RepID=A0ABY4STM5_9ENTR|nr:tRNA-modifying protein YgfZ [Candidatus Blochmannia ocreatus]URJ25326.1 tRNA-modifying protein YgfZ [Candidatus Blochmannia ocreatus]
MLVLCNDAVFPHQGLIPSQELLSTLISLEKWVLVRLHGHDSIQYLNDQFTCDIKNLDIAKYSFSAYCNLNGKVFSSVYVFYITHKEIAFICRKSIYNKQISMMKKYAIFSDVTIVSNCKEILIGAAGLNIRKYLSDFFSILPNKMYSVVHNYGVTILYFNSPIERFLLVFYEISIFNNLINKLKLCMQFNNSCQWELLDIESGYPIIDLVNSELFFPQAINMDILKGISFNKGCYLGQESIARLQYRGHNKKVLYWLTGEIIQVITSYSLPSSGDLIEFKMNDRNWRNIGVILQVCQIKNSNILWIQAVLDRPISECLELKLVNINNSNSFIIFNVDKKHTYNHT